MNKKASPVRSFLNLAISILAVLAVRWIGFEPFVIPSGSMIPTLLVNDHIVVTKYSFGIRVPFTKKWLTGPSVPARGDVVVFQSAERDDFYMIKRVIGLPGDIVEYSQDGVLKINGQEVPKTAFELPNDMGEAELEASREDFSAFREKLGEHDHTTLSERSGFRFHEAALTVPEGHIFLMGDNRDRSRDSRFWGPLPLTHLLGKAQYIWLSCSKAVSELNFICDPRYIRWQKLFSRIE